MEQESASLAGESKPASKGGRARMQDLSPEERKALGTLAANTRWRKKQGGAAPVSEPSPTPTAETPSSAAPRGTRALGKRERRGIPASKAFGKAHSYAEKRLAQCIKKRAYYASLWAALNAEIPSLVQVIAALKSSQNPVPVSQMPSPYSDAAPWDANPQGVPVATPAQQIAATRVRGGAMGIDLGDPEEDEDRFLRGTGLPGGDWH